MTSRERILAALDFRESDRVPIDFSGHGSSGIAAMAYARLRRHLGLPEVAIRIYDVVQQLAVVDDDVLDLFGADAVQLGNGFALSERDWKPWLLPDGTPCTIPVWCHLEREAKRWVIRGQKGRVLGQMPDGAIYFEQSYYPFAGGEEDLDRLDRAFAESMGCAVPGPPGPVDDLTLRRGARELRSNTDRAILGLFGGNLLETGHVLYRNDNFLLKLAAEPVQVHAFLDRLVERHLGELQRYLDLVGDAIDIIVFGDDLGMQTGPQISPEMYREFFKPRHALLWRRAKELAPVKVMLHCCGGVRELLPDLIDAGLDAINPVQISCAGMEAAGLKADFGAEITFWGGGCDTRSVLPDASPEQVAAHVRDLVKIWKPGGGYVFQQVHNILANVPPENVAAMFEAARAA